MKALVNEEERIKAALENKEYKSEAFIHHSYKKRGIYKDHLKRYLQYFPSSQIMTLNSEDLFEKPHLTLAKVFDFVGVDPDVTITDVKPRKVGRNRTKVDTHTREYLEDYFKTHNQELYNLIDEDFGW